MLFANDWYTRDNESAAQVVVGTKTTSNEGKQFAFSVMSEPAACRNPLWATLLHHQPKREWEICIRMSRLLQAHDSFYT